MEKNNRNFELRQEPLAAALRTARRLQAQGDAHLQARLFKVQNRLDQLEAQLRDRGLLEVEVGEEFDGELA